MKEIKAPYKFTPLKKFSIFLSGSIEQGKAVNWQDKICSYLEDKDIIILNPRRDDWDSSWVQSITNPQFKQQVEWELEALEKADLVVVYFDKDTKSPITLLELGLLARSGKLIVCCPKGFWRKGNVDIICERYDIQQVDSLEELVLAIHYKYTLLLLSQSNTCICCGTEIPSNWDLCKVCKGKEG